MSKRRRRNPRDERSSSNSGAGSRDYTNARPSENATNTDTILTKDFSELNFFNPVGVGIDLTQGTYPATPLWQSFANVYKEYMIPGIMVFDVLNGPGISTNGTSAINIASRNLYTYMRNKKNGTFPFEHQDATMFILAMDSAFTLYTEVLRVYRAMLLYSSVNRYLPQILVESMGYDYPDLVDHIKDLKGLLDLFAYKLRTLYVPASYKILSRHQSIYRGVYADAASSKAQLYLYRNFGFYVWNEMLVDEHQSGYCKYYARHELAAAAVGHQFGPGSLWNFATISDIMNFVYDSLMNSEDVASINGYMLSVYGPENCATLTPLGEDDNTPLQVTFDMEELQCMHNATILPQPISSQTCDVTQDNEINRGWLIWEPQLGILGNGASANNILQYPYYMGRLLDSRSEEPTAEEVSRMTRYMVIPELGGVSDEETTYKIELGADNIVAATIYTILSTPGPNNEIYTTNVYRYASYYSLNTLDKISKFDYAPLAMLIQSGGSGSTLTATGIYGELNNFTTMDARTLKKIKEADIAYLWNITSGDVPT